MGLLYWFQSIRHPALDVIVGLVTRLGEETVFMVLGLFILWCVDKKWGFRFLLAGMVGSVVNQLLKAIFLIPRPWVLDPEFTIVESAREAATGYSFPSGHSSGSVANYTSIGAFLKKKWAWAVGILIPLLVGLSRFCVGVHFPTDVLFGWALGLSVVLLAPFFQKKFEKRWVFYLIILLLAVPGWFYCKTNDFYTSYGMMVGFFAGDLFEEKYVKFKNTKCWWKMILRVLGGGAVYFALNALLKMPFSSSFLHAGTFLSYLVRAIRYAVILFVDVAIYPLCFDRIKFGKKA